MLLTRDFLQSICRNSSSINKLSLKLRKKSVSNYNRTVKLLPQYAGMNDQLEWNLLWEKTEMKDGKNYERENDFSFSH